MRPPDQARWNPLPGDVACNGKAERTVVDRWLQTCALRAWIDWVKEVVHAEQ